MKIAGIKAGQADGFFFPEAVVCAFVWAGDASIDVTNNSYFADPYEYNCRNDKTQHAIWKAEQRAIKYAQSQGVTVVAAAGNDTDDISHPTRDVTSPDDPPGRVDEREITITASSCRSRSPASSASRPPARRPGHERGRVPGQPEVLLLELRRSRRGRHRPGRRLLFGTAESVNGRVLST